MTRSLSCGLHGLFVESWRYHPLGLPVLGLFLMTAGQSLLPRGHRSEIRSFIGAHESGFKAGYLVFVMIFVGYGILRAGVQLCILSSW